LCSLPSKESDSWNLNPSSPTINGKSSFSNKRPALNGCHTPCLTWSSTSPPGQKKSNFKKDSLQKGRELKGKEGNSFGGGVPKKRNQKGYACPKRSLIFWMEKLTN
jgi:hypothetical protein